MPVPNHNVIGERIPLNRFSWQSVGRAFVADMSDFGRANVPCPPFGRLYSDACDVGFVMVSARQVGVEVEYVLWDTIDGDEPCDIKGWTFRPTADSIRRVPGARGTKVVIFNT